MKSILNFRSFMKPITVGYGFLVIALLSAASSDKGRQLREVANGYMISYDDPTFSKATTEGMKVDVALVDFSPLAKAKNEADTTAILGKIYGTPSMFSIVTGTLSYVSENAVVVNTKARFKVNISDPKYGLILVENDGKDNSGATSPSPILYSVNNNKCTCTGRPCSCCCIRKANGDCRTCAIKAKI